MWSVLLSDGTRALAAAGRWTDAPDLTQRHHGIGLRMLDGRQIAILAHVETGDRCVADRLIDEAVPHEPWEHAVSSCLRTITRRFGVGDAVDQFLAVRLERAFAVFVVRLGVMVVHLAAASGARHIGARAADHLASRIDGTDDAYVAREVIRHPRVYEHLPRPVRHDLGRLLRAAALDGAANRLDVAEQIRIALDIEVHGT